DNGGTYNNFINFSSVNALGSYIGGIVGSHGDTASANGLTQCVNYGEISSAGQNIGGVAGAIFNSSSIDECANLGPVNGDDSVGGIVGTVAATSTVSNTFSIGAITCTTCSNVGGAAGSIGTTGNLTAFSWINYGDDSAGNCYYDNQAALLSDVGC